VLVSLGNVRIGQPVVTDAIAHWESKTVYRFVLRTPANAHSPEFGILATDHLL
jgi:hypothetical protein